jgi:hypothetical protein
MVVAAVGGLSLALGFVETFREQFCDHWRWQTARPLFWLGGFLLLAALGAVLLSRNSETNATRTLAIYAAVLVLITAYAVLALSVDGINAPFVSEDLLGGSDACAETG